jgi:hypothetical protein
MKTGQLRRNTHSDWEYVFVQIQLKEILVLVFGNRFLLEEKTIFEEVKALLKNGHIVFGTSFGYISADRVCGNCITIAAI